MTATYNDGKVQMYAFDDSERVYVDGKPVSGICFRRRDSGTVLIQTKKKQGVFSTCLNMTNSLLLYGSLAYIGFQLDEIRHQIFDNKAEGIEQMMQEEAPCEYLRENTKESPLKTPASGQAVYVVAQRE